MKTSERILKALEFKIKVEMSSLRALSETCGIPVQYWKRPKSLLTKLISITHTMIAIEMQSVSSLMRVEGKAKVFTRLSKSVLCIQHLRDLSCCNGEQEELLRRSNF